MSPMQISVKAVEPSLLKTEYEQIWPDIFYVVQKFQETSETQKMAGFNQVQFLMISRVHNTLTIQLLKFHQPWTRVLSSHTPIDALLGI